jgi:WS/DGAT/MGAT family acyltransferase
MHIGGLYIFEGNTPEGPYNYQRFLAHVKSRLHIADVFTDKIAAVPMGLNYPYWVKDSEFDVELHCPRVGLVAPYDLSALMGMAADIFSRPLDRTRPLWEAHYIEGLNKIPGVSKNSFALVFKIHHCAIDGISGEEILASLLDISPEPREEKAPKLKKERVPFQVELLARSIRPTLQTRGQLVQLAGASAKVIGKSMLKRVVDRQHAPPALFSAPPTPFNDEISPHRSFSGTQLSLETIKEIKKPFTGVTVNDVILAVCAGALEKYLKELDAFPEKSLNVMAPISVRTKKQKKTNGNRVSSMLISLATDISDPAERLQNRYI